MRLVKYFDPTRDWEHYKTGSFKFGTLRGYRESNLEGDRFSDSGEGTVKRNYGRGTGSIENFNFGGFRIGLIESLPAGEEGSVLRKMWEEKPPAIVSINSTFNCNVFCASFGPYDKLHHMAMLKGVETEAFTYLGNNELTAYAEIDLVKFENAIRLWVMRNSIHLEVRSRSAKFMRSRAVIYGGRSFDLAANAVHDASIMTEDLLEKLIFTKPLRYSTEREYRCALTLAPLRLLESAVDIFPKSYALKNSIVRMGRI